MKPYTDHRIMLHVLLIFLSLLGLAGCAQNSYSVNDTGLKKSSSTLQGTNAGADINANVAQTPVAAQEPKPVASPAASAKDAPPRQPAKSAENKTVVPAAETQPKTVQPETTVAGRERVSGTSKPGESFPTKKVITGLKVVAEGIEVSAIGNIESFKTFNLAKPQRMVLDVYGASTTVVSKTVPVGRFGISTARLGSYPDKVRIVFDTARGVLPSYKVVKTDNGLLVQLAGRSPVTKNTSVAPVASSSVAREPEKSVKADPLSIESIDFQMLDGFSRVTIRANAEFPIVSPAKTADGLAVKISDCRLPARLQRPFNTKAFASGIQDITPYQVKTRGKYDTKILVRLRQNAPFTVRRSGDTLQLDVKNVTVPENGGVLSDGGHMAPTDHGKIRTERVHKVAEPQAAPGKKVYTGRRITLEFADADIRKIFQLIAEVSNLNFLLGDDVTGTISIKLVNVPWDQALDVILETKGLGMKREGNIVVVRPVGKIQTLADEQQAEKKALERGMELQTKVFDLNFASVADVANQFNALKSERGFIAQDTRTNRVIVTDIVPNIEKMKALLNALDIPERQVMIEARIVEATSTFTQDLGIQWGLHATDTDILGITNVDTGFGGVLTGTAPTGAGSTFGPGMATSITFGKLISGGTIDLKLSAAAQVGQVKIISSPKVVTLNNKAAKISQGQMIPYSTVSAEGTKTEFVEAALTLEVTPHITADNNIAMKIKATNNSAAPAAAGTVPAINKKEATTELLVKNGETTVIGGIYQDSDSDTKDGVPFFMNIPLLGWLFKSDSKSKTKTELLIFITPRIAA